MTTTDRFIPGALGGRTAYYDEPSAPAFFDTEQGDFVDAAERDRRLAGAAPSPVHVNRGGPFTLGAPVFEVTPAEVDAAVERAYGVAGFRSAVSEAMPGVYRFAATGEPIPGGQVDSCLRVVRGGRTPYACTGVFLNDMAHRGLIPPGVYRMEVPGA